MILSICGAFCPTHELVLLTKFHNNKSKDFDYLLDVYFGPSHKYSLPVSTCMISCVTNLLWIIWRSHVFAKYVRWLLKAILIFISAVCILANYESILRLQELDRYVWLCGKNCILWPLVNYSVIRKNTRLLCCQIQLKMHFLIKAAAIFKRSGLHSINKDFK